MNKKFTSLLQHYVEFNVALLKNIKSIENHQNARPEFAERTSSLGEKRGGAYLKHDKYKNQVIRYIQLTGCRA